jgi:acetoin utilization protein AcuC
LKLFLVQHVSSPVSGLGFLDQGDTPAFVGVYEAAARVVGTTCKAAREIMSGSCQRAFTPIAGLHHARRDHAAGFCVFNDAGVVIELLRREYGLRRIAYVDIDAHHGDGVFYSYEADPDLVFADLHEDGRFLYPGTGAATETGRGEAAGSKLNIPLPMGADDDSFAGVWPAALNFIAAGRPEFILLQCGADSLRGDPITHLAYSAASHQRAAADLCRLADRHCQGRLLAMGGGGYDLDNIGAAWSAVVKAMIAHTPGDEDAA